MKLGRGRKFMKSLRISKPVLPLISRQHAGYWYQLTSTFTVCIRNVLSAQCRPSRSANYTSGFALLSGHLPPVRQTLQSAVTDGAQYVRFRQPNVHLENMQLNRSPGRCLLESFCIECGPSAVQACAPQVRVGDDRRRHASELLALRPLLTVR